MTQSWLELVRNHRLDKTVASAAWPIDEPGTDSLVADSLADLVAPASRICLVIIFGLLLQGVVAPHLRSAITMPAREGRFGPIFEVLITCIVPSADRPTTVLTKLRHLAR